MSFDERHSGVDWQHVGSDLLPDVWINRGYYQVWYSGNADADAFVTYDAGRVRRAVEARLGLALTITDNDRAGVSLAFLEPIIEKIPRLLINSEVPLKDLNVLERAHSLEELELENHRSPERVDLSQLLLLARYRGSTHRSTVSVLANPRLRELHLDGPPPKQRAHITAPIERLTLSAARGWIDVPDLPHPEALRDLMLSKMRPVDIGSLLRFPNLNWLRLFYCDEVFGLEALPQFSLLDTFIADQITSDDDWSAIVPMSASTVMVNTYPRVPRAIRPQVAQRGWGIVFDDELDDELEVIAQLGVVELIEFPESEGTVLSVTRFAEVQEAFDRAGYSIEAGGHTLEDQVRRVIGGAHPRVPDDAVRYDSEGSMTSVTFTHREDAIRVATLLAEWIYGTGTSQAPH